MTSESYISSHPQAKNFVAGFPIQLSHITIFVVVVHTTPGTLKYMIDRFSKCITQTGSIATRAHAEEGLLYSDRNICLQAPVERINSALGLQCRVRTLVGLLRYMSTSSSNSSPVCK